MKLKHEWIKTNFGASGWDGLLLSDALPIAVDEVLRNVLGRFHRVSQDV